MTDYDSRFAARAGRAFDRLTRSYFRYQLRGTHRVPRGRPVIFVANHAALGTADLMCLTGAFDRHYGGLRRSRALLGSYLLDLPLLGTIWRKCGAVEANDENAHALLNAGNDLVVFPGGDGEASRAFTAGRSIELGRDRDYVRLALDRGIPIVPVATIGSHATWRLGPFGVPLNALALAGLIALTLAGIAPLWLAPILVVLALLPNPVRITSELLPAIEPAQATREIWDPEEQVETVHEIVHASLSRAVAEMQHGSKLYASERPPPPHRSTATAMYKAAA